jgi:Glycosyl hydrolases family 16
LTPKNEDERTEIGGVALLKRAAEAATLRIHVNARLKGSADKPLILLGDLNDGTEAQTTSCCTAPKAARSAAAPSTKRIRATTSGGGDVSDLGGEIDVMEVWGYQPAINAGSTHDPGNGRDIAYQDTGPSGRYRLPNGGQYASDFHVFAIEWEADAIRFYATARPTTALSPPRHQPAAAAPSAPPGYPPRGSGSSISRSSCSSTWR